MGFVSKRVVKGAGRGSEFDIGFYTSGTSPVSPSPLPLRFLLPFLSAFSASSGLSCPSAAALCHGGAGGLRLSEWQGGRGVLNRGPCLTSCGTSSRPSRRFPSLAVSVPLLLLSVSR